MNRRMIGRTVGKITLLEAVLLVLPMLVCAIYREWLQLFAFFAAAASAAIIGVLLTVISKPRTTEKTMLFMPRKVLPPWRWHGCSCRP